MKGRILLGGVLGLQAVCAFVFVGDILSSVIGLSTTPIPWELRELIEIGAALGLMSGLALASYMLVGSLRATQVAEERLRRASGAFHELMQERFATWGLTPAEREVALFAIKGLSTADIAQIRGTSEGTVKAQTNAIYRKAGVSGRAQLLSLFIEDLLSGPDAPARPAPAEEPAVSP